MGSRAKGKGNLLQLQGHSPVLGLCRAFPSRGIDIRVRHIELFWGEEGIGLEDSVRTAHTRLLRGAWTS